LIWAHGLGDTSSGFVDVFMDDKIVSTLPTTKIVLLQAPMRNVTINNGEIMPSWYDILNLDIKGTSWDINID